MGLSSEGNMRIRISALLASLLLIQPLAICAKQLVTIPAETAALMKRGRKLSLVWTSLDFEGTKGIKLGGISDASEDRSKVVLEYFPVALRRLVRTDSPYTLHLTVVSTRFRSSNQGTSRAYVEIEGRILDQVGRLVGAFVAYGDETIGGSESDNARLAVNGIVSAMAKELFSSEKVASNKGPAVIETTLAPVPVVPKNSVIAVPSPTETRPIVSAPAPANVPKASAQAKTAASQKLAAPGRAEAAISPAVRGQMKRGKKLDLVWVSPGFDGSNGLKLGSLVNQSGKPDKNALDYFPSALRRVIKADSPYTFHLALVNARFRANNQGASSAYIEVEGQLLDQGGQPVCAFTAHGDESIGGDESDNARLAVNAIASAMTRELFPSELIVSDKSPAVIVPSPSAGSTASKNSGVIIPAPSPSKTKLATSIPTVPQSEVVDPLISPVVWVEMKKGKSLGKIWIGPGYDRSRGFSLGEVRYRTNDRNDGIDKYLPDALAAISEKDAPCMLQLHIVDLAVRVNSKGVSNARLGVEGRLLAKDGAVLAAFTSQEMATGTGDTIDDCRRAAKAIVQAINKELH